MWLNPLTGSCHAIWQSGNKKNWKLHPNVYVIRIFNRINNPLWNWYNAMSQPWLNVHILINGQKQQFITFDISPLDALHDFTLDKNFPVINFIQKKNKSPIFLHIPFVIAMFSLSQVGFNSRNWLHCHWLYLPEFKAF